MAHKIPKLRRQDSKLYRKLQEDLEDIEEQARVIRSEALRISEEKRALEAQLSRVEDHNADIPPADFAPLLEQMNRIKEILSTVAVQVEVYRDPSQAESYRKAKKKVQELQAAIQEAFASKDQQTIEAIIRRAKEFNNACEPEPTGSLDARFQAVVLGCALADQKELRKATRGIVDAVTSRYQQLLAEKGKRAFQATPDTSLSSSPSDVAMEEGQGGAPVTGATPTHVEEVETPATIADSMEELRGATEAPPQQFGGRGRPRKAPPVQARPTTAPAPKFKKPKHPMARGLPQRRAPFGYFPPAEAEESSSESDSEGEIGRRPGFAAPGAPSFSPFEGDVTMEDLQPPAGARRQPPKRRPRQRQPPAMGDSFWDFPGFGFSRSRGNPFGSSDSFFGF